MRWSDRGQSQNVEDDRGSSGGRFSGGGARLGLGGMLVLLVLSLVFKRDFFSLVGAGGAGGDGTGQVTSGPVQSTPEEEKLAHFVGFVLDTTQAFWAQELPTLGAQYHLATLVLFRDGIQSACGFAETASGPFYCPGDQKVYIDLQFYEELKTRFHAPGEFAEAYVIAHEVGHHVQNLLGISARVDRARSRASERQSNALSVRLELQADCFAGVWGYNANRTRHILQNGDIEAALNAATQIGDDTLQRGAGRTVNPDSFTHGSSAQRVEWFKKGINTGDIAQCDTFKAAGL